MGGCHVSSGVLFDTRILNEAVRFGGSEVGGLRLDLISDEGAVTSCRLTVAAGGPTWPPSVPPDSGWEEGAPAWQLVLGLATDLLPTLDGRDAVDVAADLVEGRIPELAAAEHWYLLVATSPQGESDATGWAASATLGTEPPPPVVTPLVARVVAAMFEGGYRPRRDPAQPFVVVAATEPEDGWSLAATVDDAAGDVIVAVSLPERPAVPPGTTGPGNSGLATFAVTDDGTPGVYASVATTGGSIPSETVAGMIDAVIDAARQWMGS